MAPEVSVHATCFACGAKNPDGLHLRFEDEDEDGVVARCVIGDRYHGYDGVVQGGIVSLLLDSAMANCLFRQGVEAMTARLRVRFHHPLKTGVPLQVRAATRRDRGLPGTRRRIHVLEATVEQAGLACASAVGTFVQATPPA